LDLGSEKVEPYVARVLTHALNDEVQKHMGLTVIRPRDLPDGDGEGLSTTNSLNACPDDQCLSEVVEKHQLDLILRGHLIATDDVGTLALTLIDVKKVQLQASFQGRVSPPTGRTFLEAVPAAVATLFPDHPLRADKTVGVDPLLLATMDPPPLAPWVFWTGVGSTALLAGGTATAFVFAQLWANEYRALVEDSAQNGTVIDGAQLNALGQNAQQAAQIATIAGLATILVGAATATTIPFTDWRGLRGKRDALAAGMDAE
jgi:hypothetical protein